MDCLSLPALTSQGLTCEIQTLSTWMIREEDGKGSLKGPAEIPRENKGGTEPSKTPCILFAGTGFTIVSANPKISRLSPLSPTVPQKGLLSRHSLEVFVLFSVYFPF